MFYSLLEPACLQGGSDSLRGEAAGRVCDGREVTSITRISANEAAAIGAVRAMSSAQVSYSSTCGGGGFASRLAGLLTPLPGSTPFLSADFALASRSGYVAAVRGDRGRVLRNRDTCNRAGRSTNGFIAYANPLRAGSTGVRRFGVSESGVLRWDGRRNITNRNRYNRAQVSQLDWLAAQRWTVRRVYGAFNTVATESLRPREFIDLPPRRSDGGNA